MLFCSWELLPSWLGCWLYECKDNKAELHKRFHPSCMRIITIIKVTVISQAVWMYIGWAGPLYYFHKLLCLLKRPVQYTLSLTTQLPAQIHFKHRCDSKLFKFGHRMPQMTLTGNNFCHQHLTVIILKKNSCDGNITLSILSTACWTVNVSWLIVWSIYKQARSCAVLFFNVDSGGKQPFLPVKLSIALEEPKLRSNLPLDEFSREKFSSFTVLISPPPPHTAHSAQPRTAKQTALRPMKAKWAKPMGWPV